MPFHQPTLTTLFSNGCIKQNKQPKNSLINSDTGLFSVDALNDPVMSSLLISGKNRLTNSGVYGGAMTSRT